jgi:hypothetical protein
MRALAGAALALLLGAAQAQGQPAARIEGDAIVYQGRIEAGGVQDFLKLLQDAPAVTRLVITSGGGAVAAALDMADAVHARALEVDVPNACFSSCANYVFPAGRRKRVGRVGAVAWHGNMAHVLYLAQTGQGAWNDAQLASARLLARREADFYARIGVDGFVCWFGKIAPYEVPGFYTLSAQDMARFGIRDVAVAGGVPPGLVDEDVRLIAVDGARLEADRPAVGIEP